MIRVDKSKCESYIVDLPVAIQVPIHNQFFKTAFGMIIAAPNQRQNM